MLEGRVLAVFSAFPSTTYFSSASWTRATNRSNVFFVVGFCAWHGIACNRNGAW